MLAVARTARTARVARERLTMLTTGYRDTGRKVHWPAKVHWQRGVL